MDDQSKDVFLVIPIKQWL